MATVDDVTAKAGQFVVITYPHDAPNRMIADKARSSAYHTEWAEEVTLTTEQAVNLYNDLRHALFD